MRKHIYAFVAGAVLTGLGVFIGLWANLTLSGDPLAVAETTNSIVDNSTILLTTLFVGLSAGHYIGGSFKEGSKGRWFALGANLVLWLLLGSFIGLKTLEGGPILKPITYGAILILSCAGLFSLHRADLVEDESRMDQYIRLFSSRGTALVVTVAFIVRTVPNPTVAAVAAVMLAAVGIALWHAYGDQIVETVDMIEEKFRKFSTANAPSEEESA